MADAERVTPAVPVLVVLPAEIDMVNAEGVFWEIAVAFACDARVVVADMTATTFCDSMGVRALVLAWRRAADIGAELRLAVPCARVLRMMELLGLDRVLPVYHCVDEALRGCSGVGLQR